MKRCLVTGAGGLIGAHIVEALLDAGCEVVALVRPAGSRRALGGLSVEIVEADVSVPDDALTAATRGCDTVFHAAAYFAYHGMALERMRELTVAGTENVLRAAASAGVKRAVVTSSSVVYGYHLSPAAPINENALITVDTEPLYVAAKAQQHVHALELACKLGIEVLLACPTITLGPTSAGLGPSNGLIAAYLSDAFRCTYPGGCNLVSAKDVAHGHLLIASLGAPGDSYILGSENLTWREIHNAVADLTGISRPAIELNHTLAYLAATAEELRARFRGSEPLSSREQAMMIGRYYWYSHEEAGRLGYAPGSGRAALIEAISWLVTTSHISREIRTGLRLSSEVYEFRTKQLGLQVHKR